VHRVFAAQLFIEMNIIYMGLLLLDLQVRVENLECLGLETLILASIGLCGEKSMRSQRPSVRIALL
jgi:hypothetical protein